MARHTSSALLLALALLPTAASANKDWPAPEIPGIYDAVHPHWRDTVVITYDGTYRRGSGDPGTWKYDGKVLALKWTNWGDEPVTLEAPGRFASADKGFRLTKRPAPAWLPGEYDAVHPHWRATLVINADGTVKNGNKPLEKWSFDGKNLVFHWSGYGPEPVQLQSEGVFSNPGGFSVKKRGQPAAPVVLARDCGTGADDPGCSTQKDGAFPMDKDEFGGLMTALKSQRNEITRKEMALGALEDSRVTARQFGQIIALFVNELNRMEVVNERAARMVDPKRALGFAATFRNGLTAAEYTAVINGLE